MNVNDSSHENETFNGPPSVQAEIISYSILLVWSLVANVLVIAVVYCNQNMRTNMNYLIVNMAVSDLLIPLVAVPWSIAEIMLRPFEWLVDGPLGEASCKLVSFLSDLSQFVSSISLVIIALQRFMAVVYPTRGQILSRKTRWIAISLPWIIAIALCSYSLHSYNLTERGDYTRCEFLAMNYFSITTAIGFVFPSIVIIILYTILVYKLRQSLKTVRNMVEEETIRSIKRRNRKIFSMLITIVVLFIICWCPFSVFNLVFFQQSVGSWSDHDETLLAVMFASWYMWYLQAAINPCIYFVFLKDFRQGLKSLFCCRKTTAAAIEPIPRQPRTPGEDSNQDPTCAPPHINTTSV